MRTWLFKTEPNDFSIRDLRDAPDQMTGWDGVRNYQARNRSSGRGHHAGRGC